MTEKGRPVKVTDRRKAGARPEDTGDVSEPVVQPESSETPEGQRDYLDDLRRVQAEFDNYRKRMLKEQTAIAESATIRVIRSLLPVLDSFDRAADHDEDVAGVDKLYGQLRDVLTAEGLEEIPALGEPFDPQVHEAVDSVEDEGVESPVCKEVFRRGYRLKGQVIRPAMVVVARPPEATDVDLPEQADEGVARA